MFQDTGMGKNLDKKAQAIQVNTRRMRLHQKSCIAKGTVFKVKNPHIQDIGRKSSQTISYEKC